MKDVTGFMPNGFRLRSGAGGGDPANGLCYMETVALIAGEPISDHPECACPVITNFGIRLNDGFKDDERQRLLPLAWAAAGSRSPEHEAERFCILAFASIDIAEMVLPIFEAKRPGDDRPRKAIEAAKAYWNHPSADAAYAAAKAADAADAAAKAAAYAADAADAAGKAALRRRIVDRAIQALRDAIKAGPHGGLPDEAMIERIERVRNVLPVA